MIDNSISSKLNKYDFITIIFIEKKRNILFRNKNGKYIINFKKDNYYKLLEEIILHYRDQSYDIIKNSLYKEFILEHIEENRKVLKYASIDLKNNKEFVLY